jgi:hypothetical protein
MQINSNIMFSEIIGRSFSVTKDVNLNTIEYSVIYFRYEINDSSEKIKFVVC